MKRTFTALVTIEDSADSPYFRDRCAIECAIEAALECGIEAAIDSGRAEASGLPFGLVKLPAVTMAAASVFCGDRLEVVPGTVGATAANGAGAAKRMHAELRRD